MHRFFAILRFTVMIAVALQAAAVAQTTELTYQGFLNQNGSPANGNFDFQFALYSASVGGTQVGSTVTKTNVAVSNGSFTAVLDFGSNFPGQSRFLEIAVRTTGGMTFTLLSPRQGITSAPYSIRAASSAVADDAFSLGGVLASDYVLTTDTRLSDARDPLPSSTNYIQNTTMQQTGNFAISGNGTLGGTLAANTVSSTTQYNIGGSRVLGVGTGMAPGTFVGINAGVSQSPENMSSANSFFGYEAGRDNMQGQNSFFGFWAGKVNVSGRDNTIVGAFSGWQSNSGEYNSFLGAQSGFKNTSGSGNVFIGRSSGYENTTGNHNTYLGRDSGAYNVDGSFNVALGYLTGPNQTSYSGSFNTMVGSGAYIGAAGVTYGTAIGANSFVNTSNTVKLGRDSDKVIAPGSLIVGDTTSSRGQLGIYANGGSASLYMAGFGSTVGVNLAVAPSGSSNPALSISHYDGMTYTDRLVITPTGTVQILTLGSTGETTLCRNASNEIATCSSSLRYKTNIASYLPGMEVVRKLSPIAFDWKAGGTRDLGFAAEEVEKIDPLLVTYREDGKVEGVKYDRITTVLVNAVKEQAAEIRDLRQMLDQQKRESDELRRAVCSLAPTLAICN